MLIRVVSEIQGKCLNKFLKCKRKYGLSYEQIHFNPVLSNDKTKQKTLKYVFQGQYCNSRRSAKSNTVSKLKQE